VTCRIRTGWQTGRGQFPDLRAGGLSGAFSAHFPLPVSAVHESDMMRIGEAQSLARHVLGEAAYSAALARGAAMEDDEAVGYELGEFRRLAASV
jgi:hypothetical protein